MHRLRISAKRQHGNVMLVVLVFLALLASLGLMVMEDSVLQERMVFNMRDRSMAFQAAESAIREAEIAIGALPLNTYDADANGYYTSPAGIAEDDLFIAANWTNATSVAASQFDTKLGQARYFIQYLGFQPFTDDCSMIGQNKCTDTSAPMFRIVARGVGTSDNTVVLLEAYYSN